jgi:hypothetical protein
LLTDASHHHATAAPSHSRNELIHEGAANDSQLGIIVLGQRLSREGQAHGGSPAE